MLSAAIAALIAIFAKIGVENINSELATFIRTLVIISMGQHGARIGVAASLVLAAVASSCTPPDCQHEVKAAYKGLEASGRSYRRERTAPDQTRWEDFEFVPPDRMRLQDPDRHIIRVGKRAWKHDKDAGWSELPSGSAEVEFAHLTDRVGGDVTFECLGPVEFSGKTYAGYRAKLRQPVVMVVPIGLTEEQHK